MGATLGQFFCPSWPWQRRHSTNIPVLEAMNNPIQRAHRQIDHALENLKNPYIMKKSRCGMSCEIKLRREQDMKSL